MILHASGIPPKLWIRHCIYRQFADINGKKCCIVFLLIQRVDLAIVIFTWLLDCDENVNKKITVDILHLYLQCLSNLIVFTCLYKSYYCFQVIVLRII